MCEVGGSCGVAAAAADDELAAGVAAFGDFFDVVGGEVGAGVGWLFGPSWAPVAEEGAVVGDDAFSASAFCCVVVQVGSTLALACVEGALAVGASGLASYWLLAAEAGADECPHRGLRLRRWRSLSRQLGQRSPGPTNWFLQMGQRPLRPWKRFCLFLRTAEEGEEEPGGASALHTDAHHSGPGVGGYPDHCDVVEGGPGPGDPLAVG